MMPVAASRAIPVPPRRRPQCAPRVAPSFRQQIPTRPEGRSQRPARRHRSSAARESLIGAALPAQGASLSSRTSLLVAIRYSPVSPRHCLSRNAAVCHAAAVYHLPHAKPLHIHRRHFHLHRLYCPRPLHHLIPSIITCIGLFSIVCIYLDIGNCTDLFICTLVWFDLYYPL